MDSEIMPWQAAAGQAPPSTGEVMPWEMAAQSQQPTQQKGSFLGDMATNAARGIQSGKDLLSGNYEDINHTHATPQTEALTNKLFPENSSDSVWGQLLGAAGNVGNTSPSDWSSAILEKTMDTPEGKALSAITGLEPRLNAAGTAINRYVNPAISKATGIAEPNLQLGEMALAPLGLKGGGEIAPETPEVSPAYQNVANIMKSEGKGPGALAEAISALKTSEAPMTLPEALGSPNLLNRQRVIGEQANDAGSQFQQFNQARTENAIPAAKADLVGEVAQGTPSTMTDAGEGLRQAASGIINDAVKARTQAVKPLYDQIKNTPLEEGDFLNLRSNPLIEKEFQNVIGNDALMERKYNFTPVNENLTSKNMQLLDTLSPEAKAQALEEYNNQMGAQQAVKTGNNTSANSLTSFIKQQGGMKDTGGDLKAMGLNSRVAFINKSGLQPDDMAQRAYEAGYFPELGERPDINTLYKALDDDFRGVSKRYRQDDYSNVEDKNAGKQADQYLNQSEPVKVANLQKGVSGGLQPNSIAVMDAVRKQLNGKLEYYLKNDPGNKMVPLLQEAKSDIYRTLGNTDDNYKVANEDYAAASPEITAMKNGALGKLARAQTGENAAKTMMGMSREQLKEVIPQLQKVDPEAVKSMAGAWINEVTDKVSGKGLSAYIKQFSDDNKIVSDKMQVLLGDDAYKGQQALIDTLKKIQAGQPRNSETATKTATLDTMNNEGGGIYNTVSNISNIPTSKEGVLKWAKNWVQERNLVGGAKNQADLMNIFLNPDLKQLGQAVENAANPAIKGDIVLNWLQSHQPQISSAAAVNNQKQKPATGSIGNQNMQELQKVKPQSANPNVQSFAKAESGGNPNAKNPNSSASGLYQFTNKTWADMVMRHGKQTGITIADKNNPQAQAVMAKLYAKDNIPILQKALGREPTIPELYMAHVLGGHGASKLLSANPGQEAIMSFPRQVSDANRPIFYDKNRPRTVAEVQQLLTKKVTA